VGVIIVIMKALMVRKWESASGSNGVQVRCHNDRFFDGEKTDRKVRSEAMDIDVCEHTTHVSHPL
jgi:hypothetical protein